MSPNQKKGEKLMNNKLQNTLEVVSILADEDLKRIKKSALNAFFLDCSIETVEDLKEYIVANIDLHSEYFSDISTNVETLFEELSYIYENAYLVATIFDLPSNGEVWLEMDGFFSLAKKENDDTFTTYIYRDMRY